MKSNFAFLKADGIFINTFYASNDKETGTETDLGLVFQKQKIYQRVPPGIATKNCGATRK